MPILQAAGARRIVEVGALRGDTTERMVHALGEEVELHVIDPVPAFDAAGLEAQFPGQYLFHEALSLEVLDDLPAMDAALLDGDHNWYTVYNEMLALDRVAQAAGKALPLCILHDVGWPYGRRDLYYDPSNIPAEHRQPYQVKGMRQGVSHLVDGGGFNNTLANAEHEGGPRNGVLTGLEDFIAQAGRPLRLVTIPIYYGLSIVAEEAWLAEHPAVAALLDRLESLDGVTDMMHLGEEIRIEAARWEQLVFAHRERQVARGARRYLDLLIGTLVNDHYFENEMRLGYLLECFEKDQKPQPGHLADPARHMRLKAESLAAVHRNGVSEAGTRALTAYPHTDVGRTRLERIEAAADDLRVGEVPGDLVDVGVGRGGVAMFLRGYLEAHEIEARRVWLIDSFSAEALSMSSEEAVGRGGLPAISDGFTRLGLLDDRVRFVHGDPASVLGVEDGPAEVALAHLGSGIAVEAIDAVVDSLGARMSAGASFVVDGSAAAVAAVLAARARHGDVGTIERTDEQALRWTVAGPLAVDAVAAAAATGPRAPLAPPALTSQTPTDRVDLSVIVVFWEMSREAKRTLHSLSRSYQRDIDNLSFEVLVVDNGSSPEHALTREFVQSHGPEFRLVDLVEPPTPSPTTALNRGMEVARGDTMAFMIDGAHLLSPGVFVNAMRGIEAYGQAVVSTQQWYIGPGQQPDLGADYDQAREDELFSRIEWPTDGYRLFDIAHFIGDRDWFDGQWESNCMFVPRSILEQVGGFDDSFDEPGAGFANLEFFERVAGGDNTTLVTMVGEGSFHQVHGGTTTNVPTEEERQERIARYVARYAELRGRPFAGPHKPIHVVGQIIPSARRTKPRRRTGVNFFSPRTQGGDDGIPTNPEVIPEDLRLEYVDAYFRSLRWRDTTWAGFGTDTPPMDLFAYQEIIATTRPDWIIDTGELDSGRAMFLAAACDAIGHGRVLAVRGPAEGVRWPEHPRVTWLSGRLYSRPELVDEVRSTVGSSSAMVILGGRTGLRPTLAEFNAVSDLVPVDGYVVVEGTILNGRPVWTGFGPGPGDALDSVLAMRRDFIVHPAAESHGITFNRNGFLKRVRPPQT